MKRIILFLLLPALLLFSCNDEDGLDNVLVIMGHTSGASFFSDLPAPIVVDEDGAHTTRIALDLDGDDSGELTILSSEEILGGDTLYKSLMLEKHPDADSNVRISLLSDYTVKDFQDGESVEFPRDDMISLQDEFLLTWNKYIISTGNDFIAGTWNGLMQHCFLVEYKDGENDIAAWVMISVTDYDNFMLHNFASYSLPDFE